MKPTLVIAIPALRNMLLLWNVKGLDNEQAVRVFLDNSCNVGDWFVLYQLSKNTLRTWIISLGIMMTKPEFYLVRGKVGARLSLVFGQGRDPAVDILTQIQQRYLKPSFIKGTISITAQILL